MTDPSPLWVWTPIFSQASATQKAGLAEPARLMHYDPHRSREALLAFRERGNAAGGAPVVIFDLARFPDETPWAYVRDGINRSGAHPLRGLAALLREPFVDLTHLYHVPAGETGVVADCIGARYPGDPSAELRLARPPRGGSGQGWATPRGAGPWERPVCSHLHDAAILAHTEGLRVTGVLVSAAHLPDFAFPSSVAP